MWNQDQYRETLLFAAKAHAKQKVPGSEMNYVTHITNVAMETAHAVVQTNSKELDGTLAIVCALLHDTIEDTEVNYDTLLQKFGKKVADGVLALTKNERLPTKDAQMQDSLQRILLQGPEIRIVKMADRINNLQPPPHYWNNEKKNRYRKEAQLILDTLGGVNDFIEQRLQQKINDYVNYL